MFCQLSETLERALPAPWSVRLVPNNAVERIVIFWINGEQADPPGNIYAYKIGPTRRYLSSNVSMQASEVGLVESELIPAKADLCSGSAKATQLKVFTT